MDYKLIIIIVLLLVAVVGYIRLYCTSLKKVVT